MKTKTFHPLKLEITCGSFTAKLSGHRDDVIPAMSKIIQRALIQPIITEKRRKKRHDRRQRRHRLKQPVFRKSSKLIETTSVKDTQLPETFVLPRARLDAIRQQFEHKFKFFVSQYPDFKYDSDDNIWKYDCVRQKDTTYKSKMRDLPPTAVINAKRLLSTYNLHSPPMFDYAFDSDVVLTNMEALLKIHYYY
jgi:hypothetical protein